MRYSIRPLLGAALISLLATSLTPSFAEAPPSISAASTSLDATDSAFDAQAALKASQEAIGRKIGDYRFLSSTGDVLTTKELLGKPLVLSLIYTSCYHTCPMTTRNLAEVVAKARDALGEDSFTVALIGFDTDHDTPAAMRYYGRKQGIDDANWRLLSTDQASMDALVKDLGFLYYPSPRGFDHLVQASVIDAKGVIYRQIYGEVFNTPLLIDPLKDLILGRPQPGQTFLAGLVKKVKLFCTTYDPSRDAYVFDYSLFLGILIGASIILGTIVFVIRELMHGRKPPKI